MKKNILVFPCGSEIGLEIYRSLKYSIHFNLIGGNSVNDHGKFVYENYIEDIPFLNDPMFIQKLNSVISEYKIDLLYPTMDAVIAQLGVLEQQINCQIVGSPSTTSAICVSKKKTSDLLSPFIDMPFLIDDVNDITEYPVFLKPEIGYSGKNTTIANSREEVINHLNKVPGCMMMEYLPGEEYTIDCFTSKSEKLLFSGARLRKRVSNGISVNSVLASESINNELKNISEIINQQLHLRGAWFYQVKRSAKGRLKLMEVAARLGGSSAFFRMKGVNFALLTLWDALGIDVDIIANDYFLEIDRALDHKCKIQIEYKKVYIDLDDTLLIDEKVNIELIAFLYQCRNQNKEIICISRHNKNIQTTLEFYRLNNLFDRVIHINNGEPKSFFIEPESIFIDDSFAERKEVAKLNIPVFAPDMVTALIK